MNALETLDFAIARLQSRRLLLVADPTLPLSVSITHGYTSDAQRLIAEALKRSQRETGRGLA